MNITNRLYTYPVLSNDKDDYKTSFLKQKLLLKVVILIILN